MCMAKKLTLEEQLAKAIADEKKAKAKQKQLLKQQKLQEKKDFESGVFKLLKSKKIDNLNDLNKLLNNQSNENKHLTMEHQLGDYINKRIGIRVTPAQFANSYNITKKQMTGNQPNHDQTR